MIERSFSSPEISLSNIFKIQDAYRRSLSIHAAMNIETVIREFSQSVSNCYQAAISDPDFLNLVSKATTYSYLNTLKIGSRPSKRSGELSVESLRAIPWILCWTQTRVLFPTWWGIGRTWHEFKSDAVKTKSMKKAFNKNKLFRSFVKQLGFTLCKVELTIWKMYLMQSELSDEQAEKVYKDFKKEYDLACAFVIAMSGHRKLLWFRPWLKDSIYLRAPMIHPLNLIQILAFEDKDNRLIRETTTGIASGMMTTG